MRVETYLKGFTLNKKMRRSWICSYTCWPQFSQGRRIKDYLLSSIDDLKKGDVSVKNGRELNKDRLKWGMIQCLSQLRSAQLGNCKFL